MAKSRTKSKPAPKGQCPDPVGHAAHAAAGKVNPPDPQHVERKLDEMFRGLVGYNSDLARLRGLRDAAQKTLEFRERELAAELAKLQAVFVALQSGDVKQQLAAKPYDAAILAFAKDASVSPVISMARKAGITDKDLAKVIHEAMERAYRTKIDHEGYIVGRHKGTIAIGSAHLGPDDQLIAEGEAAAAELRRVLRIPLPAEKPATSKPAPAAKPAAAKPKPAAKKPKGRGGADKTAEVAASAKASKPKPSRGTGITKAILRPGKPEGYVLSYRKDGHTRTKNTVIPGIKENWLAGVCKELGIDPKTVIDLTGTPAVEADPKPAAPAKQSPGLADGWYIYSNGNDWRFKHVIGEMDADKGRVMSAEKAIEDAIRSAEKTLGVEPKLFRIIDEDGNLLEGTGADLLAAEAATNAASGDAGNDPLSLGLPKDTGDDLVVELDDDIPDDHRPLKDIEIHRVGDLGEDGHEGWWIDYTSCVGKEHSVTTEVKTGTPVLLVKEAIAKALGVEPDAVTVVAGD